MGGGEVWGEGTGAPQLKKLGVHVRNDVRVSGLKMQHFPSVQLLSVW